MIRKYKESDFSYIECIYNLAKADELAGEDYHITVIPLREDQQMLDLFRTSNIYTYETNDIVGFVGTKNNYISWLFVHPDFRGQGIGKKLSTYILSTLKGEVTLNVAQSNTSAISLYRGLGFEVTKEFMGEYRGNPISVWQMGLVVKRT